MKRVKVENLVVGKMYRVDCKGCLFFSHRVIYCGTVKHGSRVEYRFTHGDTVEDWPHSINLVAPKSRISIYEI